MTVKPFERFPSDSPILATGKLPGALLSRLISGHPIVDPAVLVGPGVGRDAAAIQIGDTVLVVKTDPITFATDGAPHYLVNVNANDLACLGATPKWILVTALLPEGKTTEADAESLFRQLQNACVERGITLVGGHTEVTAGLESLILVGQLLGTATPERLLAPGGAKPGDRLFLTKPISIEGTALLARERRAILESSLEPALLDRAAALLYEPGISVVCDAEMLLNAGGVTALHDPTEGGLAMGVRELAAAAGCGAVINRQLVPLLPETAAIAGALGLDPLGMLASGSLLAAVDSAQVLKLEAFCKANGIEGAWIGKIKSTDCDIALIDNGVSGPMPVFDTDEVSRALQTT
jgi:hydrogenase maturation factor